MAMIKSVQVRAEALLAAHGLAAQGWTFRWDTARKRFGACHYRTKTITMSMPLTRERSADAAEQTLLHEIAHALVGHRHHHDRVWLAKARSIGYTGGRCSQDKVETVDATSPYYGECQKCKTTTPYFRRPKYTTPYQHRGCGEVHFFVRATGESITKVS